MNTLAAMPKYEAYKYSGEQWMAEVPEVYSLDDPCSRFLMLVFVGKLLRMASGVYPVGSSFSSGRSPRVSYLMIHSAMPMPVMSPKSQTLL